MPYLQTAQLIRKLHYQSKVTDDQLREILENYQDAAYEDLVKVLLERKIVDRQWIEQSQHALRIRARRQRDPEHNSGIDRAFGNIAMSKGWITIDQLEEAILEQQRCRRLKLYFRLGEILLNLKYLDEDKVREILTDQGHAVGGCRQCNSIIKLVAGARSDADNCPFCAGSLSPAPFLDLVHTDA